MNSMWRYVRVERMFLLLWILGFAVMSLQPVNDPDTPWHLATGLYILAHHHVPTHDPFSWTMLGHPWVTQEWLFEVILAWLSRHAGFVGIWGLLVAVHAATVLTLYRVACSASNDNRVASAILACVGTLAGLVFWTLRPQMFSYLLFAVFLWLLGRVRAGHFRVLWLVPPLFLFWANVHASVSIGTVMLVLEVLISFIPSFGRVKALKLPPGARIRLLFAAIVGTLIGLLNPNGLKQYTYALLSGNSTLTDNIMEWHSPNFHVDYFKYGVISFLVVTFLLLIVRTKQVPMREMLYFGGSFAVTLVYQRFMPYLAITAVPLLAPLLADAGRQLMRPSRLLHLVDACAMVAMLVYFGTQIPSVRGSVEAHMDSGAYPVAAVTFLQKNHLTNHLLNAYNWGGYLIYRGVPTFVDGRTDIFLENSTFSDYLALQNLNWTAPDLLDSYKIQTALLPDGYAITVFLNRDPHWHVVYRDNTAEVLVRNNA